MEQIIKYVPLFIAFLLIICTILIFNAWKIQLRMRKVLKVEESKTECLGMIPENRESDDDITKKIKLLVIQLNQAIVKAEWQDLAVDLTISPTMDGEFYIIQADIFKRTKKYEKQIEELIKKIEELKKGINIK